MQTTRTEEDLLGKREVPLEAYWGVHTLRAVENFQISHVSIGDEPAFVRGMVQVKKASVLANKELGAISEESPMRSSGPVTKCWNTDAASTSSQWMFSRAARAPA